MSRARAVLQVQHPHLVRMVWLPGGAGFATERRDLLRLSDLALPNGGFRRLDLRQTLRVLIDVLAGLGALHASNAAGGGAFVHGEVSPHEICVDESGRARLVPVVGAHLGAHAVTELSGYAAPEKLLGDETSVVTDVYSVGVLLWEALAGRRLFLERTLEAMVTQALGEKQPRPQPAGDDAWARPLVAVSERAIAVDPAMRFASAAELASAIESAAGAELHAPRRSRISSLDLWQEEIPTSPLVCPRDELPPARTSTPPPAVLNLRAYNTSLSPLMAASPEEVAYDDESEADAAVLGFVSEQRSKFLGLVLVVALAAAAALVVALRPFVRGGAFLGASRGVGSAAVNAFEPAAVEQRPKFEESVSSGPAKALPPAPLASSWAESFGAPPPSFSGSAPSKRGSTLPQKAGDSKLKRSPSRRAPAPDVNALRYGI